MELYLAGLDCPHCAEKIRAAAENHSSVEKAEMNFMAKKLILNIKNDADKNALLEDIKAIVKALDPEVDVSLIQKAAPTNELVIKMQGLDCPNCAEKICSFAEAYNGVEKAVYNIMSQKLTLTLSAQADQKTTAEDIIKFALETEDGITPKVLTEKKHPDIVLVLENLDCAECGEKIRSYAEKMNGVASAELNFMSKKLAICLSPTGVRGNVITAVTGFVNTVEPEVNVLDEASAAKAKPKEEPAVSLRMIIRLIVTAIIFAVAMLIRDTKYGMWLFLADYAIIGADIVWRALRNIIKGQAFDECFLMTLATIGAFCVGEYPEGVAVMFLYQLGETFQSYAVRRSRANIAQLMDIRPDAAYLKRGNDVEKVSPEYVYPGDIIIVKPGEKIPLDGIITSGSTSVDTSALTGESVPRSAAEGSEVLSGCVNISGLIEVEVTKEYGESTVTKILELVENSAAKKAKTESFITRFAKIYTPCVVVAAVLLAVIPMIIQGGFDKEFLYRALSFLVVSCPCALVISVPLSFFGGIGGASKQGILVKGGNCFESLAKCSTIVFDKTGTLTDGTFEVTEISPKNMTEDELIEYAAIAESTSNHPAAVSVMKRFSGALPEDISAEEIAGKGVKSISDGKTILAGSIKLMNDYGIEAENVRGGGTVIHVAVDGKYAGFIRISDSLKPDSREAIAKLKKSGIHTVMLTGDRKASAESTAAALGIDEFHAELLPGDKVSCLEKLLSENKVTAFVGDGINDAPVLMRSDVGIAMGGVGSDAAIEAADVVLMTDEPSKINEAIRISKRTKAIVMQNIIFAIGVKIIILILTALGITSMWIAVFGDVGVAIIAILNAMRARKVK